MQIKWLKITKVLEVQLHKTHLVELEYMDNQQRNPHFCTEVFQECWKENTNYS